MCSHDGSLNLKFENTNIIAQGARVQEDSHTFSLNVRSHNIMYVIINLEGITDITPFGTTAHNTHPH